MRFRERLLATLREMQPILDVPGVMVGGSQVPNLLEPDAAATLVVSQDVDLVVPGRHSLPRTGSRSSADWRSSR